MKNVIWVTLVNCAVFTVALWAGLAFADGALPTTDAQALDLSQTIWNFLVTKNYAAAVGPGLTLFVWALKKYDLTIFNAVKLPRVATAVDTFLDKPFVSFLLPTVASALGGAVVSLVSGHSFVEALGAVWAASTTAITTYVGLRKLGEQREAGAAAAAEVTDKATAIEELKKP